jgi:hypothetical protein
LNSGENNYNDGDGDGDVNNDYNDGDGDGDVKYDNDTMMIIMTRTMR